MCVTVTRASSPCWRCSHGRDARVTVAIISGSYILRRRIIMRLSHVLSAMVVSSLVLGSAALAADTYKIDPTHGTVIYRLTHFNIGNAYGRFNNPTGTVNLDKDDASK